MDSSLPPIPAKRYFTIGEVGELCGVKPHVLRYWEQEFTQLRPVKRRGNRRYYQHHEVLMIRRIRDLLYDQGFTISGARNKLQEQVQADRLMMPPEPTQPQTADQLVPSFKEPMTTGFPSFDAFPLNKNRADYPAIRHELFEIRTLLTL
ncbi:MerR family transcriptional regulator [Limnohabitans planktonicus]|uniref:MerR family transcriptional regulator n=1 Tax=Limnohabitans planktonicus II-D5 TaxID=1293045 RepID=A0A2T7UEV6_9BURK|nr:MerR family transcriptional regulator [Limnohabitans planktonicus]PVE43245.1 MerR family transcriptional regulator [Limnohabitans planktonicus II-D5]|eukprot:gene13134-12913_t